jgi:metal-responsive CopG/Arc/MetJ family transcriptional regulator
MERVMLTMPAELLGAVDDLARRLGRKRSQLVRQALSELLDREQRREFELLLAERYREMAAEAEELAADALALQAAASLPNWHWDDE